MMLSVLASGLLLSQQPQEPAANKFLFGTEVVETNLSYSEAFQLFNESQEALDHINGPKKLIIPEPIETIEDTDLLSGVTKKEESSEDIAEEFIEEPPSGNIIDISYIEDSSKKTYMGYQKVTAKKSNTYKLLNCEKAYTDETGLRCIEVNGQKRIFLAVGQGISDKVGTLIDVKLANGNTIYAVVGDRKANKHTDSKNIQQIHDGSVVEFIVDENTYQKGLHPEWAGNIDSITVKYNLFDEKEI